MARIPYFDISKHFQRTRVLPSNGFNAQCHLEIWLHLIGLHYETSPNESLTVFHRHSHSELTTNRNVRVSRIAIAKEKRKKKKRENGGKIIMELHEREFTQYELGSIGIFWGENYEESEGEKWGFLSVWNVEALQDSPTTPKS
ncbi:LOW QUALITY PROTEIN: hypothetical protein PanWU01x14_201100 [Parasponia andersonii]|uniref:Uncharacterized protein n=1 Tax=Parasponia andersonii TaxID=3476 RepID=A0A2P5BXN1_PARAD|nr:LOW QUALITY PROTEIN: hypothetical protein PanWU01x14_201100 [Parasponia andersonii]